MEGRKIKLRLIRPDSSWKSSEFIRDKVPKNYKFLFQRLSLSVKVPRKGGAAQQG